MIEVEHEKLRRLKPEVRKTYLLKTIAKTFPDEFIDMLLIGAHELKLEIDEILMALINGDEKIHSYFNIPLTEKEIMSLEKVKDIE